MLNHKFTIMITQNEQIEHSQFINVLLTFSLLLSTHSRLVSFPFFLGPPQRASHSVQSNSKVLAPSYYNVRRIARLKGTVNTMIIFQLCVPTSIFESSNIAKSMHDTGLYPRGLGGQGPQRLTLKHWRTKSSNFTKTDYGITFLLCLEINDQDNLCERRIFRRSRVYMLNKFFGCKPHSILSLLTSSFPTPSSLKVATRDEVATVSVRGE